MPVPIFREPSEEFLYVRDRTNLDKLSAAYFDKLSTAYFDKLSTAHHAPNCDLSYVLNGGFYYFSGEIIERSLKYRSFCAFGGCLQ